MRLFQNKRTNVPIRLRQTLCRPWQTDRGAHPVQGVLIDGVAEPHLAVQRMLLVVAHQIHQTLELCRAAQHEETSLLLDATVFDLPLGPACRQRREQRGTKESRQCVHAHSELLAFVKTMRSCYTLSG